MATCGLGFIGHSAGSLVDRVQRSVSMMTCGIGFRVQVSMMTCTFGSVHTVEKWLACRDVWDWCEVYYCWL